MSLVLDSNDPSLSVPVHSPRIVSPGDILDALSCYPDPSNAQCGWHRTGFGGSLQTTFADSLWRSITQCNGPFQQAVKDSMCGQVLVDIGAGVQDWGLKFAEAAGASAYIAVEPRFAGDLFDALELHQKSKSGTMIPASIVCDDGLHCLQALGSDSVSILMAGMDSFVVRGFLGFPADWEYDEYLGEWAVGIERVLHPYGGYLNCSSVFYPRNLCRFPSRSEDDSLYAKRPFSQA